ncbi:SEC-C metal-binding domain-containing protein [Lachnospiraceae bacterium 54-53]
MEKQFGCSAGPDAPGMFEPEIEIACLEAKLLISESLPGIKKSLQIVKESYPYYEEAMEGFLDEALTCTSRAFLINKYEKKLKKFFPDTQNGPMDMENLFFGYWDESDEDYGIFGQAEPYRRSAPKIGRNQPCPCGSGKKYKNCCGR